MVVKLAKVQARLAQPLDHGAVAGIFKVLGDGEADHRADIGDPLQLVRRGGHERVKEMKMPGQRPRRSDADVQDAQAENEPPERPRFARLDCGQEVGDALFAHAREAGELGDVEPVDVGEVAREFPLHEQLDHRLAEVLDVHCAARGEVFQPPLELRGARTVDTPQGDLPFIAHDRPAARRAGGGHGKNAFRAGAPLLADFHDGGDDFARFFHHHEVADADVFAGDFLLVVQSRTRNGAAAHEYRLQLGHGGEHAGAAHLHGDVAQERLGLLGLVFVGHRPAGGFRGEAYGVALRKGVHLDHRAVRLEREIVPHGVQSANGVQHVIERAGCPDRFVNGQPAGAQGVERLAVRLPPGTFERAHAVEDRAQPAPCHDGRIKLLERSGGGVARIGKGRLPGGGALFVERGELRLGQKDFPAHFKQPGNVRARKPLGNAGNGADVLGDVVAGRAVAARGGILKHTLLVEQRNGDAVDLRLDDGLDFLPRKQLLQTHEKSGNLLLGIRVVQAEHGRTMADLRERLQRRSAHAARGRIGRGKLGVLRLQVLQFAVEPVVFLVGNRRSRLLVIAAVVLFDFPPQRGDAGGGFKWREVGHGGFRNE